MTELECKQQEEIIELLAAVAAAAEENKGLKEVIGDLLQEQQECAGEEKEQTHREVYESMHGDRDDTDCPEQWDAGYIHWCDGVN